jgi:hypothetical protein
VDWQAAAGALRQNFESQWQARVPAAPIAYRNGPKLDPAPDPTGLSGPRDWVRFNVLNGASRQPALGSRRSRDLGRVEVQIFTPRFEGDGRSRELGDTVREIWDSTQITGLQLGAAEFVPVGLDPDLPFWMDVVSAPFSTDNIP